MMLSGSLLPEDGSSDQVEADREDAHEHESAEERRHGDAERRHLQERLADPPPPCDVGEVGDEHRRRHAEREGEQCDARRVRQGSGDHVTHGLPRRNGDAEVAAQGQEHVVDVSLEERSAEPVLLAQRLERFGIGRRGVAALHRQRGEQRVAGQQVDQQERHRVGRPDDEDELHERGREQSHTWPHPGRG
jgi:hypothetical protein